MCTSNGSQCCLHAWASTPMAVGSAKQVMGGRGWWGCTRSLDRHLSSRVDAHMWSARCSTLRAASVCYPCSSCCPLVYQMQCTCRCSLPASTSLNPVSLNCLRRRLADELHKQADLVLNVEYVHRSSQCLLVPGWARLRPRVRGDDDGHRLRHPADDQARGSPALQGPGGLA